MATEDFKPQKLFLVWLSSACRVVPDIFRHAQPIRKHFSLKGWATAMKCIQPPPPKYPTCAETLRHCLTPFWREPEMRAIEGSLATAGERKRCPTGQIWSVVERSGGGFRLQLVSRLPHHKAVQALQVPPAMMLVTLLPRPEENQAGVTSNLNGEGRETTAA